MINKAERLLCFKNLNINNMAIGYHSNKKAWMTGIIFDEIKQSNEN